MFFNLVFAFLPAIVVFLFFALIAAALLKYLFGRREKRLY